jgi:hypothetical protein
MCLPVNPRGVVSVAAGLMKKILILHIIIDSDVGHNIEMTVLSHTVHRAIC